MRRHRQRVQPLLTHAPSACGYHCCQTPSRLARGPSQPTLKALQCLYYCESRLPKKGATADRIKHVRNGGEQTVLTDTDAFLVHGYDSVTRYSVRISRLSSLSSQRT